VSEYTASYIYDYTISCHLFFCLYEGCRHFAIQPGISKIAVKKQKNKRASKEAQRTAMCSRYIPDNTSRTSLMSGS